MINKANNILKNQEININYKYIIIDEYQDISLQKFNLIKKLSDITNAKIIAIGDDWQTIFSFSGSNINLFLEFEKILKNSCKLKITNTYRNSQELINIAGKFIQKNKKQIKKQLKSVKTLKNPIIIVEYKEILQALEYSIEKIVKEFGFDKNILILARFNFLKEQLKPKFKQQNNKIIYEKYKNLDITFLTVHSSKGLGYDNVILMDVEDSLYGFPSKIKNDSVFKLLNQKSNNLEEERRLFYVALTRTKNKIYILAPKKNPSIFVKEIKKYQKG